MAATWYSKVTLAASGRAVYTGARGYQRNLSLDVGLTGSLGGGVASIQISYEDAPDPAIAAHWLTLSGAENLATEKVYPVSINGGSAVAVLLTGATAPALTAYFV